MEEERKRRLFSIIFSILCVIVFITFWSAVISITILCLKLTELKDANKELTFEKAKSLSLSGELDSLKKQLGDCDRKITNLTHALQIGALRCQLEKSNITLTSRTETRHCEDEMNGFREKLSACERDRADLSRSQADFESQFTDLNSNYEKLLEKQCPEIAKRYTVPKRTNSGVDRQHLSTVVVISTLSLLRVISINNY